jgi:hypothetical protein
VPLGCGTTSCAGLGGLKVQLPAGVRRVTEPSAPTPYAAEPSAETKSESFVAGSRVTSPRRRSTRTTLPFSSSPSTEPAPSSNPRRRASTGVLADAVHTTESRRGNAYARATPPLRGKRSTISSGPFALALTTVLSVLLTGGRRSPPWHAATSTSASARGDVRTKVKLRDQNVGYNENCQNPCLPGESFGIA